MLGYCCIKMATTDNLRIPEPLSFEGNVAENWRTFEQGFRIYAKAALKKRDPDEVAYTLLNLAGKEAIERAKTFVYAPLKHVEGREDIPAESAENVEDLMKKFKEMCNPQGNVIVERHKFNTRDQKQNEPIETYIADLRSLADNCEYGDLRDELIRDRLVCGVQSDAVRKQMLKESDLTLKRALQLCQLDELTQQRIEMMTTKRVDAIQKDHNDKRARKCTRCRRTHAYLRCPAFGSTCDKCKKPNH